MKNHFLKSLFLLSLVIILGTSTSFSATQKFIDEVGREEIFPFPPKRIVSLAPNITEILFSLGLDEEIVGISIHCNFPAQAKSKARVRVPIGCRSAPPASWRIALPTASAAGNTRDM